MSSLQNHGCTLQIACNDAVVNLYGRLAAHDVSSLSELRVASGPDALESQSRTALRLMVDVLIGNEGNFPCPAVDDADDDDADDELDAMTAPVHLRTLLARPEQRFVPGTPSAGSLARRALAAAGATSNAAPGAAAHDDSSRQIGGGEHPVVSPLPPPLLPPPPLDPSGGLHATDAAVATDSESSSLRTNPNPLAGAPRGATCGDRDVAKPDRALSTGFWLSSDNGYASAVTTPASSPMPPDPDTDAMDGDGHPTDLDGVSSTSERPNDGMDHTASIVADPAVGTGAVPPGASGQGQQVAPSRL